MPAVLVPMADAAIVRHRKRRFVPDVTQDAEGWACPYADTDADRWWALLYDVFGTRHTATVSMFFDQLSALLESTWSKDWEQWVVDGDRMVALLTMVQSMKPRNEAQAAYAAQLVALHLCSMNLAKGSLRYSGGDPRSVAVLSKAARAFGDGLTTMRKLQGKGGNSKQSIKVEKRVYYQQVNIGAGGGPENGGQPHAKPSTGVVEASATVPSKGSIGQVVRLPCCEGNEGVPDARREAKRSAQG